MKTDLVNIHFHVLLTTLFSKTCTTEMNLQLPITQILTLSLSPSLWHVIQVLFSFSASWAEESDPHLLCFLVVAIDRAPTSSIRWTRQRRDKALSKIIYRHTFPEMKNKFPSTLISLSITISFFMMKHFPNFLLFPHELATENVEYFSIFHISQTITSGISNLYLSFSCYSHSNTCFQVSFSSHKILAKLIEISRYQNDALHHSTWSIPCVRRPALGYSRVYHEYVRFGWPPWRGEGERRQSSTETSCHTHHR